MPKWWSCLTLKLMIFPLNHDTTIVILIFLFANSPTLLNHSFNKYLPDPPVCWTLSKLLRMKWWKQAVWFLVLKLVQSSWETVSGNLRSQFKRVNKVLLPQWQRRQKRSDFKPAVVFLSQDVKWKFNTCFDWIK